MRRMLWIPVCAAALVVPVVVLAGGSNGFDSVVDSLEIRYHAHAMRIPFMSFVSLVAHKATNGGVSGVHVAQFEDIHAPVNGDELNSLVQEKMGSDWERIIRETSKQGSEQTLIFAHPEGDRMGVFVVPLAGHELDIVPVSVDPDHLNQSIARYAPRERALSD